MPRVADPVPGVRELVPAGSPRRLKINPMGVSPVTANHGNDAL